MVKHIILNKDLTIKDRLKNILFYFSRKRGAKRSWDKRHKSVLNVNHDYYEPCDSEIENNHKKLWSDFRHKTDLSTLRISKNISGISDSRIVPEDIYVSDIEPSLITDKSVHFMGIKSFYNKWFMSSIFPKDIFHRIDGQYLGADLTNSNFEELIKISKQIEYPVILKPNKDTYGGMDINIVNNAKELIKLAKDRRNYVVQEKIKQHDFFNRIYSSSLNTIKIYLYRSVKDDTLHILSMSLRMGKDGSLDNESAGGINSLIRNDGYLNGYAVDKYGTKYFQHPNSGINFDCKIPNLENLKSLSLRVGSQVFFTRIFALDACCDEKGKWRIIEINTYGQSIRFSQYGGQPFFGDFTEEVIAYCKDNHWTLKD